MQGVVVVVVVMMMMMVIASFELQFVSALLLIVFTMDLHRGYWSEPASRAMKISGGLLITMLRLVQSLVALAFFYLLFHNLLPLEPSHTISLAASMLSVVVIVLVMFKRGRAYDDIVATKLHGASQELVKTLGAKFDNYFASLTASQSSFLNMQENVVKRLVSEVSSQSREVRVLQDKIARYSEIVTLVNNNLTDIVLKLEMKDEELDMLRSVLEEERMLLRQGVAEEGGEVAGNRDNNKEQQQETLPARASLRLTPEDGKVNRIKGLEAQKELADIIRSWGLAVRVGYSKGVPDFKVMRDDKLVAVAACKAFTLSEGGTKQRRVAKGDINAELKYARSKQVPLVIAVKNMVTGRWWMHRVPAGELVEFDGVSTPVRLAEDDSESINFLEESVKGVKEKLLGTA